MNPNQTYPKLTPRMEAVLETIILTYTECVEPVGSKLVASKLPGKSISSATIRNDMSALEALGLIVHPHVSAGRVPTDLGYRYYIDHIGQGQQEIRKWRKSFETVFKKEVAWVDELFAKATRILSSSTGQLSFISRPQFASLKFASLRIRAISAKHIWTMWLSTSGISSHALIDFEEDVDITILSGVENFFNRELSGHYFHDLMPKVHEKLSMRTDSLHQLHRFADHLLSEAMDGMQKNDCLVEGSSNIFETPEFQDWQKARPVLNLLDKKDRFGELFDLEMKDAQVRVYIGSENKMAAMWDCSFIIAPYSHGNQIVGRVGVLGPRRMDYQRSMAAVQSMAFQISQMMEFRVQ